MIGISHRKTVCDVSIIERRFISVHMDLEILNFSFEFHTVLWAFDNQKLFIVKNIYIVNCIHFYCLMSITVECIITSLYYRKYQICSYFIS